MPKKSDGTQAVRRALKLVRLVAETQQRGARLTDLARYSDLTIATASRILRCLAEERLLLFDERTRSYRIGSLAYELGLAARRDVGLINRWLPLVRGIADETGETAYLVGRSGAEAVCLVRVSARSSIRAVPFEVGDRLPLGVGAGSLALLASLSNEEIDDILSENVSANEDFGRNAYPDRLRQAVAETREAGFSFTFNVNVPGLLTNSFRTAGVGLVLPHEEDTHSQLAVSTAFVVGPDEQRHIGLAAIMKEKVSEFVH